MDRTLGDVNAPRKDFNLSWAYRCSIGVMQRNMETTVVQWGIFWGIITIVLTIAIIISCQDGSIMMWSSASKKPVATTSLGPC